MKSVLLICSIFPPEIGGPATYAENLANFLLQKDAKVGVITYTKRGFEVETKDNDLVIKQVARVIPPILRELVYFIKLLAMAMRYDILYAQSAIPVGFLAFLVARILRKKFVIRITGDHAFERASIKKSFNDNLEDFQNKKYGWYLELLRRLDHFVAKKADKIITPSNYLRNILIENWQLKPDKITTIYNPAPNLSEDNLGNEKDQEKIDIEGEIILSVGRLVALKGFKGLIEAMPSLLRVNPAFGLVIVGEGEEREDLERLINEKGLQDRVILTGQLSKQELARYYKASDIFVLNSSHDTFPNVILEAMAYNLPVIASNTGGIKEIIKHGENGLLFNYNNQEEIKKAILSLHKNSALREQFIIKSQETLKSFSFDEIAAQTINVLNE